MGGGGAMRTASKIAGMAVNAAGLRGAPLAPAAEQSVMKGSLPVSGIVSSQGAKTAAVEVAPLHSAASWDMDDWEFADENDLVMQASEPMPRVVFDSVPSFQEAKAATTELKDALDQIYLSSSSSKCEVSSDGSQASVQSPLSELETKSCVTEVIATPSVPKHALQAFQYLSGSPEAQTVVASITSDPNVWNAVMQNPVLKDFVQSQQKGAGFELKKSSIKLEELPDSNEASHPGNGFIDFNGLLQNIKLTVAEMVSGVSNYFQNIFEFLTAEKDANGNTKTIFTDTVKGTFMGLAVLVAMVVLLKRA